MENWHMEEYINEAAETVGEQKKRAAVMIGRMNPPTRGHYKVMNAMKAFIRDKKELNLDVTPIVVIISGGKTSADKSKNPLSAEERKSFMESSGKANGVKFLIANSAFTALEEVRKAGFEPIAIAAGSDRVDDYLKMLDKYFTKKDGTSIKHVAVPGLDRDQDADVADGEEAFDMIARMINDSEKIDDSQISASLARYLARKDEEKAFAYVVGLDAKPKLALKLMDKVKAA